MTVEKQFLLAHRLHRAQHNARFFTSSSITKEHSLLQDTVSFIAPNFFRGKFNMFMKKFSNQMRNIFQVSSQISW